MFVIRMYHRSDPGTEEQRASRVNQPKQGDRGLFKQQEREQLRLQTRHLYQNPAGHWQPCAAGSASSSTPHGHEPPAVPRLVLPAVHQWRTGRRRTSTPPPPQLLVLLQARPHGEGRGLHKHVLRDRRPVRVLAVAGAAAFQLKSGNRPWISLKLYRTSNFGTEQHMIFISSIFFPAIFFCVLDA